LWERLAAAIILFRGCKPLPQGGFYGNLDFLDKRLNFFLQGPVVGAMTLNKNSAHLATLQIIRLDPKGEKAMKQFYLKLPI
jgi:hypothetical protein